MSKEQEVKDLIAISVQNNPHSLGNEDLFEDFYSDAFGRLQKNIVILGDKLPPVNYIDKVVNTVILKVLKETGRLTRRKFETSALPISSLISYNINDYGEIAFNIPYPSSEREKSSVIYEQLSTLVKNLEKLNENEPEKHFTRFFELKYEHKLKMSEIAVELGLKEEETSQRFFELIAKLNSYY